MIGRTKRVGWAAAGSAVWLVMAAGAAIGQPATGPGGDTPPTPPVDPENADVGAVEGAGAFRAQQRFGEPAAEDGAARPLTEVVLLYSRDHPMHPAAERVLEEAVVTVTPTRSGYTAPKPGGPVIDVALADLPATGPDGGPTRFYDSALPLVAQAIVEGLQAEGLIGVYVEPDARDLRVVGNQIVDDRDPGETRLRYAVTTGIVTEVRTVGIGDRLGEGENLNHPVHERIREGSPVRPMGEREGGERRDLLVGSEIDRYALHLRRHPGRRVDVAVSATGEEPGAVTLDYLVTENKPWLVFGQLANNGTEETDDWRQRFGFIHNQLTNSDDVLSIEYLTASFDEVNALVASYERPILGPRVRGRAYGSWYEYTAAEVGQADADFDGSGYSFGAEVAWNFAQVREHFWDLVGGVRYDLVDVENELAGTDATEHVVVGYAGVRYFRETDASRTRASGLVEWSIDGLDDDSRFELGRFDADDDWATLNFEASHSFYLEALFDPELREGSSLSHEIVLSGSGQLALGNRLAPNYQRVAGGLYTVRGYPQSVTAGDNVFVGTAEYRWHLPRGFQPEVEPGEFFGTPFRFAPQYRYGPVDWDFILKGFVDIGRTENEERVAGLETDNTLLGVGVGAELALSRHVNVRLDYGWALSEVENGGGEVEVDDGDSELHFVLTVVF